MQHATSTQQIWSSALQQEWGCDQGRSVGSWVCFVMFTLFCSLATLTVRGNLIITKVSFFPNSRVQNGHCLSLSFNHWSMFQFPSKSCCRAAANNYFYLLINPLNKTSENCGHVCHNISRPEMASSNCFFVWPTVKNPSIVKVKMIEIIEKQQIHTFLRLEIENCRHFCLIIDLSD